jgi:hypothetical protein
MQGGNEENIEEKRGLGEQYKRFIRQFKLSVRQPCASLSWEAQRFQGCSLTFVCRRDL